MEKDRLLQKKHPKFTYKKFRIFEDGPDLKIIFDFAVDPDIAFRPEVTIKNIPKENLKKIGEDVLQNFAFNLGLIEIPSYWKATCSPRIKIEAGVLNNAQARWWRDLLIKGLGQFFYENKIDFRGPGFVKIIFQKNPQKKQVMSFDRLKDRYLVPLGGGRDAIVTLEMLKKRKKELNAFLVNPTEAAKDVIRTVGIKNPIIVERKIDPALLKLNREGYLNGHTPFTATLSFLAAFCAILFNYKHVAFSNEKSANEGNVKYLGAAINHQYSKSSEFEKKFRRYCHSYLAKNIHYFSFLRKYGELEISKMFATHPKYFPVFSSCNKAEKQRKLWCGECPKCLFIYLTLYPFVAREEIIKIFGEDLFEKKSLLPIMRDLIEPNRQKPFECVGTKKESQAAFSLSKTKARKYDNTSYLLRNGKNHVTQ